MANDVGARLVHRQPKVGYEIVVRAYGGRELGQRTPDPDEILTPGGE